MRQQNADARSGLGSRLRRTPTRGSVGVLCLVLCLGCSRTASAPDAAPDSRAQADARAQVASSIAALIAADNAGDLDAVVERYSEDAILLGPSSPPVTGRAAIREHYGRLFEMYRFDVAFQSSETRAFGEWAFDRGVTSGTLTPLDGSAPITVHDRYLMILQRDGSEWRVARLMWNPDQAGT